MSSYWKIIVELLRKAYEVYPCYLQTFPSRRPIRATNPSISPSNWALLKLWINFLLCQDKRFLFFSKSFIYSAVTVFAAFPGGFGMRNLSVALIGLPRHHINLFRICNLITKVQCVFLSWTIVFHSYIIKAKDHSFYGFSGAVNPLGMLDEQSKSL